MTNQKNDPRTTIRRSMARLGAVLTVLVAALAAVLTVWLLPGAADTVSRPGAAAVATPTATPLPSPTCQASPYQGSWYCFTDIRHVKSTSLGQGKRVVLGGMNVVAVTPTTIRVGGFNACPPGRICGAGFYEELTISWSGTTRPTYGDMIMLYGRTVTSSLTPVGYIKTGWCHPDYGC